MNKYMKSVVSALKHWVTNQKSDWNQNDPTAANFVKNKPFYESTSVLFDQSVELTQFTYVHSEELAISDGDTVKVTWNGTEYECTASIVSEDGMEAVMVGNLFGAGTEPFLIGVGSSFGGTAIMDMSGILTEVTVKIEKPVIHTIDPKFLPEMSSYCHVNIWYDENDGGYKSDKTYDDIKAAEAKKTPVIGTLTVPSGNVYTLVGCDSALPSIYLVAFDLYSMPDTLKIFYVWTDENNGVSVRASNFNGTLTDV